jgi:pimeloyl-ACP methyl ester carboxylesterase
MLYPGSSDLNGRKDGREGGARATLPFRLNGQHPGISNDKGVHMETKEGVQMKNNYLQRRFARMQSHWIGRTVAAVTAIGLTLLLATGAAAAQNGPKPTVVLVHGGFSSASVWDLVSAQLQRDGYPVIAPANPLRGPDTADSAYLTSVLDTLSGPVILVGHSYGGFVITNAAAMTKNAQNVKALVYVAAFIPDVGERGEDLTPGSLIGPAILQFRPCPTPYCPAGLELYIDNAADFQHVLAADLSTQQTSVLAAAQRGVSANANTEPSEFAAWHTVPSFAIVPTADNAIGTANELFMAQRANAQTVQLQGASHFVLMSQPKAVVSVIEAAAGQ